GHRRNTETFDVPPRREFSPLLPGYRFEPAWCEEPQNVLPVPLAWRQTGKQQYRRACRAIDRETSMPAGGSSPVEGRLSTWWILVSIAAWIEAKRGGTGAKPGSSGRRSRAPRQASFF